MDQIPNEAVLNRFRFPIDRGLSDEVAELRLKIALKFLASVPYNNIIALKGISRDRAIRSAFDWADAVVAFMQEDAEGATPSVPESAHTTSAQS